MPSNTQENRQTTTRGLPALRAAACNGLLAVSVVRLESHFSALT